MRRIQMKEAAHKAGVSYSIFRKVFYGFESSALLEGFPAPCARAGRVLWLESDVDAWLAAQSTYSIPQPQVQPQHEPLKRGRGRPRKLQGGA